VAEQAPIDVALPHSGGYRRSGSPMRPPSGGSCQGSRG
jgi:hypothetical protein